MKQNYLSFICINILLTLQNCQDIKHLYSLFGVTLKIGMGGAGEGNFLTFKVVIY